MAHGKKYFLHALGRHYAKEKSSIAQITELTCTMLKRTSIVAAHQEISNSLACTLLKT